MNGKKAEKAMDLITDFISDIPMSLNGYNNPNSNQWVCDQIDTVNKYIDNIHTTLTDCIALLTQSGSNTKEIVMGKLKGLVE